MLADTIKAIQVGEISTRVNAKREIKKWLKRDGFKVKIPSCADVGVEFVPTKLPAAAAVLV